MDRLVIGTRRYSSWSLRGWLAVRCAGLDVPDEVIALRGGGQTSEIHAISPNGMVPYLVHQGARIWESLAICEYCAEIAPILWPADRVARAVARSVASEMHAGFRALRIAMPMNLGRTKRPLLETGDDVLADIARIDRIWCETRERFGATGPYLFGADFCIADIMFAPVVSRFTSYGVTLSPIAEAYRQTVLDHPLMREWARLAALEPTSWHLERYEALN
ncbi:glutathione S-transferase family protein [Asaia sp. As-1742]|uniref:glutathione S-transferase family protein n=1 Tax=Asaia sp. As-1742 TaxID=2608325 RepID=UPI00141EFD11|nr:glutathione S-transferase family protein [Asaia sp. As-1742]NIE78751.1 glutathione S-transferase family protein [Asaia sp. As-1742]